MTSKPTDHPIYGSINRRLADYLKRVVTGDVAMNGLSGDGGLNNLARTAQRALPEFDMNTGRVVGTGDTQALLDLTMELAPLGMVSGNMAKMAGKSFNFSKLPTDEAKTLMSREAESLANLLRKEGFEASVEYSGSKAGPSVYVSVFDPKTMRFIKDPARFSNHSKGAFNNQFIHNMDSPEDVEKFIGLARSLREMGPAEILKK